MKTLVVHSALKILFVVLLWMTGSLIASAQEPTTYKDVIPLLTKARSLRNKSKIIPALEVLKKAMELAQKNDDKKALVDTYHEFSIAYLKIERIEDTKFYWDRATTALEDLEYPYGNGVHKYVEALLLYQDAQNFQSLAVLEQAKQLNNDRNFLNNILLTEANIYLDLKKYKEATKNLNSLVVNTDIYEKEYLATRAYLGLAKLNYLKGAVAESVKNGEFALKIATANNFTKEHKQTSGLLAKAYEDLKEFDKAYTQSQSVVRIADYVLNGSKLQIENEGADEIQDRIKTKQIVRLELKVRELTKSQNRSELTAILTSAFLTIISLLAVSLFRNNQIKLKTNDLLQTKNKELQIARDGAVQAMEAKTNFLSTVSHELRTPLYAVTGLTHLLLEENPSENQKEHLKALKFSGDYLLNFINDILQINKIDARKLEPLNMEFNLKKIINEVIDSLHQSAKANKTTIILQYDDAIPHYLMSDPIKLSQIFMNLIGNAIKFTKEGQVEVCAKLVSKEGNNVKIFFEVKDDGIGISDEKCDSIFEGFEQGSIQINREYGGTGLGLTIVKSLLGLFNSEIKLESTLGEGSSFFFEIDMESVDRIQKENTAKVVERDYNFEGLHLLIVEDNKINQVITKKMLSKKSITSDIASNGEDAVAMVKENKYDGILMDIHMPGISGEEATIQIRKFNTAIPIIALTAISLDDSLESFYAAGCNDVVTKPFKPENFYQKIGENMIDKKIQIG